MSDKRSLYIYSYEDLVKQVEEKNATNATVGILSGTSCIIYNVPKSVLRPTHVRPKERFSASFTTQLPELKKAKKERFKIEVDFAGDIHTFQIKQKVKE